MIFIKGIFFICTDLYGTLDKKDNSNKMICSLKLLSNSNGCEETFK